MVKKMVGKKCPKFEGECTSGLTLSNKSFDGRNLVIYFCTFKCLQIYIQEKP